ncbi:MAG: AlpA family phage regulatory protein [Geobacteraceae bacterium]|nr:AlpA family phage regulatory protein [Geobacteraceae bacterium]
MKYTTPPPEAGNVSFSPKIDNPDVFFPTLSESVCVRLSALKKSIVASSKIIAPLPETGYVRLPAVLAVIPISKSTWWNGVRDGRYPKPTKKFGPRISAWDVRDIRALIESAA